MVCLVFQSTLPVWGATDDLLAFLVGFLISIHAPRVGSDAATAAFTSWTLLFQSTLPVWGATSTACPAECQQKDFNPRSPCGERPGWPPLGFWMSQISIHAPRVGSDRPQPWPTFGVTIFQSTLPVWGATPADVINTVRYAISIHAPRVGSDGLSSRREFQVLLFQSTLPVWGATIRSRKVLFTVKISIHAPRVGSDVSR